MWLAFGYGLGPDGLWWGLLAGLGVAAVGLPLRFLRLTSAACRSVPSL